MKRICIDCGIEYKATGKNQKRCGSKSAKTGCSYERARYIKHRTNDGRWRNSIYGSVRNRMARERGLKCEKCGLENDNPGFFDFDHINPRRNLQMKGNANVTRWQSENLRLLCPNCHRKKTLDEGWRSASVSTTTQKL